ncbi:MurR/RpiR family transcriptional regulator [Vagococcus xieshaowenii]|uniref:MurR/RpiR family transcriptional regulator n=1 Tax=Vagococcus xieshaowenii TaxID=2562451 RepID=A0AAJ5EDN0_9ENTE|nr:MurR/RpiR family transcriptional regulator [Vagococcus xieshaowenii]QCA27944.1 MurR/RpiR family transcriptional regulator [Vagococcus xieshaowenii]TFZ40329.1 MurR/RpiR family transcriptional regulator [Vagococcus xieshaowenii]
MEGKMLENRIHNLIPSLSKAEQKIATYVLNYPEKVITMTASQLAQASETSPATVIRFCRSVGIESYTELKVKLSAEISKPQQVSYSDITPNESISEIKEKLLSNANHTLNETVHFLEDEVVEQVAEAIYQAEVVYVYGIGASFLVAENIAQKFNRIGKLTMAMVDHQLLLATMAAGPSNSLLIGVSNLGETKEVVQLVKIAQQYNLTTVGLSQFGQNSLNQAVDLSIKIFKAKETEQRSAATSSLLNQFMAVDVLFYTFISKFHHEYSDNIINSKHIIETFKATQ